MDRVMFCPLLILNVEGSSYKLVFVVEYETKLIFVQLPQLDAQV